MDDKMPIHERVMNSLMEHSIDMSKEMAKLFEEEKLDDFTAHHQLPGRTAKIHYDKEDLIQFHELMLSKPLVRACSDLDYEHPTVIQRMCIPAILEGHDIMAHSVTGSGKTAAYLLPMMQKYLKLRQTNSVEMGKVRYLVLTPTRELAAQCHSML